MSSSTAHMPYKRSTTPLPCLHISMFSVATACVLISIASFKVGVLGFVLVGFDRPSSPHNRKHEHRNRAVVHTSAAARLLGVLSMRQQSRVVIDCISAQAEADSSSSSSPLPLLGNARPMELWLDARGEGATGKWQSFQESADVVLCDTGADGKGDISPSKRRVVGQDDGKLFDGDGNLVGASVAVVDPKGQSRALSLVGSVEWIQVGCSDWTMIPAENLVSAAGGTGTKIAVELSEPSQVQGAAFALQIGVDALVLRPDNDLWSAGVTAREQRDSAAAAAAAAHTSDGNNSNTRGTHNAAQSKDGRSNAVALSVGMVMEAKEGGIGDRVCVDLIQSLAAGEGMLVGSSAKMLALVHAETFETGFVPARPFRVNAGPVHSYALMADRSTKYLSELCAGDQVMVVDWEGHSRPVAIGRLKVEMRPMIMIEYQGENGNKGQLFLQQAETVRLISPTLVEDDVDDGWRPLSVTDVEGGEPLLLRETSRGTHVGKAIDAIVSES